MAEKVGPKKESPKEYSSGREERLAQLKRDALGLFSTDSLQREHNPAYALRDQLYEAIRPAVKVMTIDNIVRKIKEGIGEGLILRLQEIGKENCLLLNYVLPPECAKAVMDYRPGKGIGGA
ncbi:MAG: hypothetical protein QXM31_02700 [Candidatus Woesearchaeota archaeon]